MLGLFITIISVFTLYVGIITTKYGILPSISDSYYHLPKKYNFLFTLAMWGFSIPIIIMGVPTTGLMFFAGAGISFVGAAAAFKQKMTKTVHYTGAGLGILLGHLAISLVYGYWYITAIFVLLSSLILIFRKYLKYNHIFWIEIFAFISIILAYWFYYF